MVDVSRLPEHMRRAAELWAEQGLPHPLLLGGFMRAVLTNDLIGAFAHADETNTRAMKDWTMWLYNDAPSPCHGSAERLDAWHERHERARRAREDENAETD